MLVYSSSNIFGQWQEEGHRKGAKTGIWGEYSTISRENNVCNNSREIKDFIKNIVNTKDSPRARTNK